ncbi:MAG: MFS transporter [Ectothiorhodospiraceae bacterium]|nr:MFS transporter [Ectothiorhodospiraceae bacterium]
MQHSQGMQTQDGRNLPARLACILVIFTAIFSSNVPTPLYAVWQAEWGFSSTALTAVFSVYVIGVVLTLPTLGALSDQVGRRQVLVPGVLFIVVGSLVFAFADNLYDLALGRFLTGLGTGVITGTATAALVELDPDRNWPRAATISALMLTAGATMGPTLSSLALHLDMAPLLTPFLMTSALGAFGALTLLVVRWPSHLGQRRPGFRLRNWRPQEMAVPREIIGAFAFAAAAFCLSWSAGSIYAALGPLLAAELVGIGDRALAGLYAAAFQLVIGISQFSSRHQPPRRLLLIAPLVLALGMLICVAGILLTSPLVFALGTATTALGCGATSVGALGTISLIAPENKRGGVISAFYVVAYCALATVVLAVGASGDAIGLKLTMVVLGGVCLVAAGGLVLLGGLRRLVGMRREPA